MEGKERKMKIEEQLREEIKKVESTIKWILEESGVDEDDQKTRIENLNGYIWKLKSDLHHLTSDNHEMF